MNAKTGIVWILGAGFSRSLGGPLLPDLMSRTHVDRTSSLGDFEIFPHRACDVYARGRDRHIWRDAEEFLNIVERSTRAPEDRFAIELRSLWTETRRLGGGAILRDGPDFGHDMRQLHRSALAAVASATSGFLKRARANIELVTESEQWEPYVRWAEQLQSCDTVISFNYDSILSLLAKAKDLNWIQVVKDSSPETDTQICHLHGQVNWRLRDGEIVVDDEVVALADPDSAVLGLPGERKKGLSEEHLNPIWTRALERLRNCTAAVFVGYRFPPSDNYAKRRILETLRVAAQIQVIRVVLGPDNTSDVARLRGLLDWIGKGGVTTIDPLFAEDFLAVFEREHVTRPARAWRN